MGEPVRNGISNLGEDALQTEPVNLLQPFALMLEQMRPAEIKLQDKGKDLENVRLKLARPKKGLPSSFKKVSKLINDTEDMLQFFAPETRNNEIEHISRAALELYGFTHNFPEGNTAESIAFRVANFYMPEDTKIYAPRQEFSQQQYMLGKLAEGGLYQLPDLLLFLDQGGKYIAVRSHSDHLFSKDNEFFGTLISLQRSSLSKEEYDNAKTAKHLIYPIPQELMKMVEERRDILLQTLSE